MLKEVNLERQTPGKHAETGAAAKSPRPEDIFEWSKSNPELKPDGTAAPDQTDINLGFPVRFGGAWGGAGEMIRYIELNPFSRDRPASIVVEDDHRPGERVIKVRKKPVSARILLGNPSNGFAVRYSLTPDGWYQEKGELKREIKKQPTAQEILKEMQDRVEKCREEGVPAPTVESVLKEMEAKLEEPGEEKVAWYPKGRNKKVDDSLTGKHIEDIVRREGSVYTKKRA